MSDFKFNAAQVVPQTEVEIAPRPADSVCSVTLRTDAERISAARLRAIVRSKQANSSQYSWEYHPSYWEDFAGPQTSKWDAAVLTCLANVLEVPKLWQSRYSLSAETYDTQTGLFNVGGCPPVSIQELKDAVQNRITELGLLSARVWEWYATFREPIGREWWREPLETRINRFREVV